MANFIFDRFKFSYFGIGKKYPARLGPRVKKIKNGYPESSKDGYSINSKKYIWSIRNHCIASFSELHNDTKAKKVWWPMCVMCMHAFNTHAIISATRYQI